MSDAPVDKPTSRYALAGLLLVMGAVLAGRLAALGERIARSA